MAGHSKWANIKHKKAREDAKRGKIFSKLAKEITVAAKLGGGDPEGNPRLRHAIDKARSFNMPKDNIERAIKKGTGESGGADYEQVTYEGYGPGGVAVLVEVLTDNRNRTVGEIRHAFSKNKGNLGENGCVAWLFESKGYLTVPKSAVSEEQLLELALEAGAEDVRDGEGVWEVLTEPDQYDAVRSGLEQAGVPIESAEVTMLPKNTVKLQGADAERMLRLMEMLEDNDDVQNVYANFDIEDAEMERIAGS
ncbi:YebC/PmpR family DNA-binding transcriptional regulator [Deferrisoma camini]|uniref:YebC/PmpR family DNA-binding transcriptional regulator n=1 Tax=Deferrisoma camini TaxID=1035120 RepID=UPI00046D071A|nr:YebC/PmpR family DNA-binding transcriptional regulator [Deferrisoma camini]